MRAQQSKLERALWPQVRMVLWVAVFVPVCAALLLAGALTHWVYLFSGACWAVALVCVLRMETLRQPAMHASPRALLAQAGWVLLALLLIAASALPAHIFAG